MNSANSTPYVAVKTSSFLDTEQYLSDRLGARIVTVPRSGEGPTVTACNFKLDTSEIWHCRYSTPVVLAFPEQDILRVQFQQKGNGTTRVGANEYAVTQKQAVISGSAARIDFGEGFEQQVLRVDRAKLVQKMVALTDEPLMRPLAFEAAFNPQHPRMEVLRRTLVFIEELMRLPQEQVPSLVIAELEQTLYTAMLGSLRHNYVSLLERQAPDLASRQVHKVEQYIEAHWNHPILIEDIVAVSGCSARSIFRAFQKYRGYTPMAFVKQVRLQEARRMLRSYEEATVTRVALACGFSELGRFSREYAQVFGELPSQTLKASRHVRSLVQS